MRQRPQIRSIRFDRKHRPLKAVIHTRDGFLHVHWLDVCGDWCWFTSGALSARRHGIHLIPRIEELGRMLAAYPECDTADLRNTLEQIAALDPYTIYHEPINIRANNVDRIAAHAHSLGITLNTDVFSTRHRWKDYALDALMTVEKIAAELGIDDRLHLWPDRTLGSKWVVNSMPVSQRTDYVNWLRGKWARISEWPGK